MAKPQQPVVQGSIADRLRITSAAIHEVLNLRKIRPTSKFTFALREDDTLS